MSSTDTSTTDSPYLQERLQAVVSESLAVSECLPEQVIHERFGSVCKKTLVSALYGCGIPIEGPRQWAAWDDGYPGQTRGNLIDAAKELYGDGLLPQFAAVLIRDPATLAETGEPYYLVLEPSAVSLGDALENARFENFFPLVAVDLATEAPLWLSLTVAPTGRAVVSVFRDPERSQLGYELDRAGETPVEDLPDMPWLEQRVAEAQVWLESVQAMLQVLYGRSPRLQYRIDQMEVERIGAKASLEEAVMYRECVKRLIEEDKARQNEPPQVYAPLRAI